MMIENTFGKLFNPKHEIRNSKQIQMIKIQNQKGKILILFKLVICA